MQNAGEKDDWEFVLSFVLARMAKDKAYIWMSLVEEWREHNISATTSLMLLIGVYMTSSKGLE